MIHLAGLTDRLDGLQPVGGGEPSDGLVEAVQSARKNGDLFGLLKLRSQAQELEDEALEADRLTTAVVCQRLAFEIALVRDWLDEQHEGGMVVIPVQAVDLRDATVGEPNRCALALASRRHFGNHRVHVYPVATEESTFTETCWVVAVPTKRRALLWPIVGDDPFPSRLDDPNTPTHDPEIVLLGPLSACLEQEWP